MSEKYYAVALRKRINSDRFFEHDDYIFEEVKIETHGRYWIADPFLFEKDGKVYLFYEAFDLISHHGYIAYSLLLDQGTFSEPRIIIKGGHKSFPYIFENKNGIYIMPESCVDYNIKLYKAVYFPDVWKEERILVSDIFSVDTIFLHDKEKLFLLTSEQYQYPRPGKVVSCWVKNRLMEIPNDLKTDPETVRGEVVSEGEEGIRNAGAVFDWKSKTIRPGQDCKNGVYGKGLKFFEVSYIESYMEKLIYEVDCTEMQTHVKFCNEQRILVGTHTYNSSPHYEIIDFSYLDELAPAVALMRVGIKSLRVMYHRYQKMRELIFKVINKVGRIIRSQSSEIYEAIVDEAAPWVFVSYIADSFYHRNDQSYLNRHQNKREVLVISDVFNKLGYNAYFMLYNSNKKLPDREFRLIFGHEPNIQRANEKYKNAKMIYYGVSTYFDFRNKKIKEMTNAFNERFDCQIPERRLVKPHTAIQNSDAVLLIGSKNTIMTYPEEFRGKVTKIHQSTQSCKYLKNVDVSRSKEFFYLASSGNILKGAQAVVEFFSAHPEYELHWIGPIEKDVQNALSCQLTENIHIYGYQKLDSNIVLGLAERCDFMIYPSGVEGGVPGSLLNAMKSGLIPLVTLWAAFDGIEEYGYVMDDANVKSVEKAVIWAMSLTNLEIAARKKACQKFVLENYNLERFAKEFENFMMKEIGMVESEEQNAQN